ncbi:MAG: aminotransferase class V-fold PLP-dependent enzyme [Verrucomicrobia bacterium]|nr:aminotransferase class V-fold PLP-dependent enzyme [Verrucomicrobiota bacterium]
MDFLAELLSDEQKRKQLFPICQNKIFLAHASVTTLPWVAADAMIQFARDSAIAAPDFDAIQATVAETRRVAAKLVGSTPEEIALIGPTALGLSLFANGLEWQQDDEVICYLDDYPANVYPWLNLRSRGVSVRFIEPAELGAITPELVESALNDRTRLVALASCNFVSGYRIETEAIGKLLREKGILFSVDAIQTLGAFPFSTEYVDFLSADAHKWMLGPVSIGIVYVRKECFELCRPTLLGSTNVKAPGFISQQTIEFQPTAQRYEPGVVNIPGIIGMKAALELLLQAGVERIAEQILHTKDRLISGLRDLGFSVLGPISGPNASGITTAKRENRDMRLLFENLKENNVVCSLRQNRQGTQYIRFSPHFYNTEAEIDCVLEVLAEVLRS